MRDIGDRLDVGNVIPRISNRLDVEGLSAVVDQVFEVLWFVPIDEFGGDAESRQEHLELVVGA